MGLAVFLGILTGVVGVFIFFGLFITFYLFSSLGLMKIADKNNLTGSWMAWIPILNFALIGKIAFNNIIIQWTLPILFILTTETDSTVNGKIINSGSILPPPLNSIGSFVWIILIFVCIYKIYNKMSDKAVIMTILSILSFGFLIPIFLFAIRKNEVRAV